MPRKKIKIISSFLFVLLLVGAFIFSEGKSSYLPISTSDDHSRLSSQGSQEVESASVSIPVSPVDQNNLSQVEDSGTEGSETYEVTKVIDGDTIEIDDTQNSRVRIIGIDTPETVDPRKAVQCFGKEASEKAKEILSAQFVTLVADQSQGNTDKYKRLLRYIRLPDGSDYGLTMISQGYAHEYTYNTPYEKQGEYKQAEINARNGNLGLWSPSTCNGNK